MGMLGHVSNFLLFYIYMYIIICTKKDDLDYKVKTFKNVVMQIKFKLETHLKLHTKIRNHRLFNLIPTAVNLKLKYATKSPEMAY